MLFRKFFVFALLAGAALLAVSCEERKEPDAAVIFITPTNGSKVPRDVVPVSLKCFVDNCGSESVQLFVDGVLAGTDRTRSDDTDTVDFTWDASSETAGSRPKLMAILYTRERAKQHPVSFVDSASIEVTVDTGGGPVMRIVAPEDGDTLAQGDVPILVSAPDTGTVGMHRVEFLVDEVILGADSSGYQDTWRCTWAASQALPGSYAIKAKAYKRNGQRSVEQITVVIRGAGPTYHHGFVDTSETWSPNGNPHIIDGDVNVRNGAWLTIEPGCIVKATVFGLEVGYFGRGGIKAIGTASAPILLTSNKPSPAPGDWGGIAIQDSALPGTRLSWCTVEYAGPTAGLDGTAFDIRNGNANAEIDNCVIRMSGRYGVSIDSFSGIASFHDNTVTQCLSYPLRIGPNSAAPFADNNNLDGNDSAGVLVAGTLKISATWPNLGVPYIIKGVTVGDATNDPVLTIEPGTEIRFRKTGSLAAGNSGGTRPGRIVADGSAGRIAFTSMAASPAPGDFYGVSVYEGSSAESEFSSCDFSYGGGTGGDNALLYVHKSNPVITGCDFGYSAGYGITFRTTTYPDTSAIKAVNTFHDNASGTIKWLLPSPGK